MKTRLRPSFIADALTISRALLAIPLFFAAGTGWLEPVAVMLVVAWWTDFFDGRLARSAPAQTRIGSWDPIVDAAVGTAVLGGLAISGAGLPVTVAGGAVLALYLFGRNPAWCMLLQAIAYGVLFERLAGETPVLLALPLVTAITILVLNRRRLFGELIPTFFSGIASVRLTPELARDGLR